MNIQTLIAVLPDEPTTGELLKFVGMGIFVVVSALASLAIMSMVVGFVLNAMKKSPPPVKPADPVPEEGVPEETMVLIAAAVAAVISQPARIVHVRGLTPDDMAWALQGRSQIHASHALKPQDSR
ncbi:hypothetical protein [Aeoliella mucimassa]|uniref:hypothetical protein n=1 Tax=Aeoliella mucimassa TaxID=2527972 RepID=UPI0011A66AA6|nr:hypothetical protein [Aeoliella mucimassa]